MILWKTKYLVFFSISVKFWISLITDSHRAKFQNNKLNVICTKVGFTSFLLILQNNQGFHSPAESDQFTNWMLQIPKTLSWSCLCWYFVTLSHCWLQTVLNWPPLFIIWECLPYKSGLNLCRSASFLVSYPTRWSLLFIFGFLYGSSIFLTSSEQRNIVQLCTIQIWSLKALLACSPVH